MPPPRLKRSNTAGAVPSSLEDGEIAINQADGKLFYRTAAGGVSTAVGDTLTQAAADSRYVNVTGDTMTGGLTINAATPLVVSGGRSAFAANGEPYGVGVRHVSAGGAVYFGATDGTATPGAQISNAGGVALMSWTNAGAAAIPGTLTVGGTAVVVTTDARLSDSRAPLAHTQAASTITDFASEAAKYGPVTSVNGLTGAVTISAGTSISDGSKGDITVSGSGATWTINANAVVTADIAGSAVTYEKIQNVSATDRLLGRSTAGAGLVEEIVCTAFGRSVIAGADAAAVRSTINAVSNAGGTISGELTCNGTFRATVGLQATGARSLFRAVNEQYAVGFAYSATSGFVHFGARNESATPDAVISNAGGTTLMTLQTGGNVGIGTTSPSQKLDVNGNARVAGSISRTGESAATDLGLYSETASNWIRLACNAGDIRFFVDAAAGNQFQGGTAAAVLNSAGNFGIGTESPTTPLDVNGSTMRLRTARTPSATGAVGEVCWDASYVWICTATNTWRRVAHSTSGSTSAAAGDDDQLVLASQIFG